MLCDGSTDKLIECEPEKDSSLTPLLVMIDGLSEIKFYGKFEVNFENGKITHCKKTESIKL